MAIEERVSIGGDAADLTDLAGLGWRFLQVGAVTMGAVVWVGFWGLVLRLHYQLGDLVSAAVVGGFFVLPVIVGYGFYVRQLLSRVRSS